MSNIPPLRLDSKTSDIQLIWFYEIFSPTKTRYHILDNIIFMNRFCLQTATHYYRQKIEDNNRMSNETSYP